MGERTRKLSDCNYKEKDLQDEKIRRANLFTFYLLKYRFTINSSSSFFPGPPQHHHHLVSSAVRLRDIWALSQSLHFNDPWSWFIPFLIFSAHSDLGNRVAGVRTRQGAKSQKSITKQETTATQRVLFHWTPWRKSIALRTFQVINNFEALAWFTFLNSVWYNLNST